MKYLLILLIFFSCNGSGNHPSYNSIQQGLIDLHKDFLNKHTDVNSLQNEENQRLLNSYIDSYFLFDLKKVINGFIVTVDDLGKVYIEGKYCCFVSLKMDDGYKFYEEHDKSSEDEVFADPLYNQIINLKVGSLVKLYAHYDNIGNYNAEDINPIKIPKINIEIDSIKSIK